MKFLAGLVLMEQNNSDRVICLKADGQVIGDPAHLAQRPDRATYVHGCCAL